MNGVSLTRLMFLGTIQILAIQLLHACATLPATFDQGASATSTRGPNQAPSPIPASATPTPVPSPTATNTLIALIFPTDTPVPTEPPLAIFNPSLGYDCSQVERLPVSSPAARALAEALVASYKEILPTEYIAIEDLWAVERLGEHVLIQMRITDEAAGIFVIRQPPVGLGKMPHEDTQYEYLAGHVWGGWPFPSRFTLPELFTRQLPDAPPELFYCMSLSHIFFDIPLSQELDLSREYNCATVETVPPDSPPGWAIGQALLDYWVAMMEPASVKLDRVYAIQRLKPYLAIQARFLINDRLEPPEIFIAKETEAGYQFGLPASGDGSDRTYLLRFLYAQDTSIPPELLACLKLDGWLLATPTPAP